MSLSLVISGCEIHEIIVASAVARGIFIVMKVSCFKHVIFVKWIKRRYSVIFTTLQGANGSPVLLESVISLFLLIGSIQYDVAHRDPSHLTAQN